MNYTHLTIEERCCLREYYLKGYSYRKIAGVNLRFVLQRWQKGEQDIT